MSLPAGTPFVVFGDDWGRHVSTMQHVFRHIIPRFPVVWVNAVGHRVPELSRADARRALEKGRKMLRQRARAAHPGHVDGPAPLAVLNPAVLPWHHIGAIHALNTRSMLRTVRTCLRQKGLVAPPVLVTGSPPTVGVVGRLGELASVYFCMDDFLHMPGTTPWMLAPLEQRLLERVDVLVATAEVLTRTKAPRSGRAHHLPQGVNYAHFAEPRPEPDDLRAIPRPRIGFAGGMKERCDLELLVRIADANPAGSVVLVGPVFVDLAPLNRPNVHVLGARPYAELPAYVQAFDVAIIPYRLTKETEAVDPLKLLEYLAAGLPVVSTALPEAYKYRDAVAVAESTASFVRAVATALAGDREVAKRRAQDMARANTWDRRAEQLLDIVGAVALEHSRAQVATPA